MTTTFTHLTKAGILHSQKRKRKKTLNPTRSVCGRPIVTYREHHLLRPTQAALASLLSLKIALPEIRQYIHFATWGRYRTSKCAAGNCSPSRIAIPVPDSWGHCSVSLWKAHPLAHAHAQIMSQVGVSFSLTGVWHKFLKMQLQPFNLGRGTLRTFTKPERIHCPLREKILLVSPTWLSYVWLSFNKFNVIFSFAEVLKLYHCIETDDKEDLLFTGNSLQVRYSKCQLFSVSFSWFVSNLFLNRSKNFVMLGMSLFKCSL